LLTTTYHRATVIDSPWKKTRSTSALLDLPPELRNRIYERALSSAVTDGQIEMRKDIPHTETNVLATCHQIRKEAAGLYHSALHFKLTECPSATAFLTHLTEANRKLLTRVTLVAEGSLDRHLIQATEVVGQLPSLQRLTLELLSNLGLLLDLDEARFDSEASVAKRSTSLRKCGLLRELMRLRGLRTFALVDSSPCSEIEEVGRCDKCARDAGVVRAVGEGVRRVVTQPKPRWGGVLRGR